MTAMTLPPWIETLRAQLATPPVVGTNVRHPRVPVSDTHGVRVDRSYMVTNSPRFHLMVTAEPVPFESLLPPGAMVLKTTIEAQIRAATTTLAAQAQGTPLEGLGILSGYVDLMQWWPTDNAHRALPPGVHNVALLLAEALFAPGWTSWRSASQGYEALCFVNAVPSETPAEVPNEHLELALTLSAVCSRASALSYLDTI